MWGFPYLPGRATLIVLAASPCSDSIDIDAASMRSS